MAMFVSVTLCNPIGHVTWLLRSDRHAYWKCNQIKSLVRWTKPSDAKVLCGGIPTSDEVQTQPKGAFCNYGGTATNLVMSNPGTFSQCSPFPQSQEGRLRRTLVLSKWQRAVRWPCTVTRVRGWRDPGGSEQVPLRGYSGQHTILAPIPHWRWASKG